MQNLISCMSVLFSSSTLSIEEMEEFQDRYGQGVSAQDVRSDARKVSVDLGLKEKYGIYPCGTRVWKCQS